MEGASDDVMSESELQPEEPQPQRQSGAPASPDGDTHRRDFLSLGATAVMSGGLIAGYGALAAMAVEYLYRDESQVGWQFVAVASQLKPGDALDYTAPSGAKVVVARQGEGEAAGDFVALSSICPHLGCQVHWESQNDRFFCPCHNGAFDRQGNPILGPPKTANQPLTKFRVSVEGGLVFVEVPLHRLGDKGQVACDVRPASEEPAAEEPAAEEPAAEEIARQGRETMAPSPCSVCPPAVEEA
ncbi:MAG: Rieske (2Fe-2S) protein [Pirellulaceae bacterium]